MNGFPKAFAERMISMSGVQPVKFDAGLWFLPSHPSDFEKVARSYLTHNRIHMHYGLNVESLERSPDRILSVQCKSGDAAVNVIAQVVIDCSGEGVICSKANHEMIMDSEYQAAAIVFSMKYVDSDDEYALKLSLLKHLTQQVEAGAVPAHYQLLSIIPHTLTAGTIFFKLGLPWNTGPSDTGGLYEKAKTLVNEMVSWLTGHVAAFRNASLDFLASEVGVRTGVRAKGKALLKDVDVLEARKSEDGICNGAWPVEYWRTGNRKVEMTYFRENDFYTIPAGCLQSAELGNLYFGGKIISAEEKAIASARVIGTCLGTGYAAGMRASFALKSKTHAEAVESIRHQMNQNA